MEHNSKDIKSNILNWTSFFFPIILYLVFIKYKVDDYYINLIFFIAFLFIIYIYFISERNQQLNKKRRNKDNYGTILFRIISVSLSAIIIISTFQSDKISSYLDHNSKIHGLKWMNIPGIINFPINQFELTTNKPNSIVNLKDQSLCDSSICVLIIDKTKSIKNFKEEAKALDYYIKRYYSDPDIIGSSLLDKTVFLLVNSLTENTKKCKIGKIAIFFYDGHSNILLPISKDYIFDFKTNNLDFLIKEYNDQKNVLDSIKKQETIINKFILYTCDAIETVNEFKNYKISLCLISDYVDEERQLESDNINYTKNLKKLSLFENIEKISIIKLPSNNSQFSQGSTIFENEFYKTFLGKEAQIYNVDINPCTTTDYYSSFYKDLNYIPLIYNLEYTPINFYYPYPTQRKSIVYTSNLEVSNTNTSQIRIKFNDFQLVPNYEVWIDFKDNDRKKTTGRIYLNEDDFYNMELKKCELSLNSNYAIDGKDLFLNFVYEKNDRISFHRFKVNILPILSDFASTLLILLFSILIISLTFLTIIPSYIHTYIPCNQTFLSNWYKRKYLMIIGLVVTYNLWYINLLLNQLLIFLIIYISISILVLLFLYKSISLSLENHKNWIVNYCNENENK